MRQNVDYVPFMLYLNIAASSQSKPASVGTSCDSFRAQPDDILYQK